MFINFTTFTNMIFQSKDKFLYYLKNIENFTALGIDFGLRKSGLALYNSEVKIVIPYLIFYHLTKNIRVLICLIRKKSIDAIIIGYPIGSNNQEEEYISKIMPLVAILSWKCNIPTILSDERFTTSMANKLLKRTNIKRKLRNEIDDLVSVCILLENFFY